MSSILDGVRDATAGLKESIEASQATIGAYQRVILEEKAGVRIMGNVSPSNDEQDSRDMTKRTTAPASSPSHSIISIHSTASEKARGKRPEVSFHQHSYSQGEGNATSRALANHAGGGARDSEGRKDMEISEDEWEGSSDDSVSSGGLTNTSDDSRE